MTGFMSLSEVDRRAKDLGMSYGQYVAQYRSDEVIRTRPEPGYGFGLRPGRRRLLSVGRTREGMQKYADTIVEMYGSGYSLKDIALEIGVTEFELARFLSKAGLTREECMGRVLQKNAVHTGGTKLRVIYAKTGGVTTAKCVKPIKDGLRKSGTRLSLRSEL